MYLVVVLVEVRVPDDAHERGDRNAWIKLLKGLKNQRKYKNSY